MAESGTAHEAQDVTESRGKKPAPTQDAIRKLKTKLLPGFKYTLLFSLIIYLAMLIIGILAVKKCPVNENIPLFLCIIGFVGLASKLVTYLRNRIVPYFKIKYVETALYTTEVVFFFLGAYWVYKEYKPSFNPADGARYCQKTAYMYAFIYITAFFAFALGILLLVVCVLFIASCSLACRSKSTDDNAHANESRIPYVDE
ncbi:hypothetical protein WA026_005882 [Henosepilachna vigintioctopunctata]|uniref:MARVEL domain-containing protein n=1 Tax=Henosepilachna vigintioctopunctata TaxID=420089 RepID=A0AAW1U4A9_9CUCU